MTTEGVEVEERPLPLPARALAAAQAIMRSNAPAIQVARFVSHYVQMSIAMVLGMLLPVELALSALGLASLTHSPEGSTLVMTGKMVIGMTAWMAIRRHSWRHMVEMSAGMAAPIVFAAVASLAGLLPPTAAGSTLVTILMWLGMLGAMLFRWRDYAEYGHCHGAHKKAAA